MTRQISPEGPDVMDIAACAEYLGISTDTLYKYAGEGKLPAFKLGNRWRFRKALIEVWIDEQSKRPEGEAKP